MSDNGTSIERYFKEEVIKIVRDEIRGAHGNEVLFFGWTDRDDRVEKVEVKARGNDGSVALPMDKAYLPDVVIHNHPDGNLIPSHQDVIVSSQVANRSVGFFIIDNEVTDVYVVVEPVEKRVFLPLDAEKLIGLISSEGPLCGSIPLFEEREGQKEMIRYICDSFNQDAIALIEGGTGIGKSLAYLIPSIEWSVINKDRVVVSTNTINLQEQLLYKDIPDLERASGYDFSYILMKGRGNYVCINRVCEAKMDLFTFIDEEEVAQFNEIVKWIDVTDDGSLSDLSFIPKSTLWEKLNSQTETCLGSRCEYFNKCFVNKVRRRAVSANIIVTNHHYLLADASLSQVGSSIIPSFKRVIFDEAHNLEDSATSFFTKTITLSMVIRLLNRLCSGTEKKKGYLVHLLRMGDSEKRALLNKTIGEVNELKSITFNLFEGIEEFFNLQREKGENSLKEGFPLIEVNEGVINSAHWEDCVSARLDIFYRSCKKLVSRFMDIKESLEDGDYEIEMRQVEGFTSRLLDIIQTIDIFLNDEDRNYVRWIEKKKEPSVMVSLIDVGSALYDLIFKDIKSSVLTSATLTVDGRFDFLKKRLALPNPEIEARVESPFNYDEQMAVIIPEDTVEPENPEYYINLGESVLKIIKKTGGKAFVLFTSYKTLDTVYDQIRDEISELGLITYKQGMGSRKNLLLNFTENINSILFGTESFWEGVDAPGETLECVIITKLPFKVPTEPIVRARLNEIKERGGNSFLEYTLPLAVIKLRQGIGRLIRKKTDHGIIVILDKRILLKSYGSIFLRSIPCGKIYTGRLYQILERAKPFLSNNP